MQTEEIAKGVAEALAEYSAEVAFAPEFELHELSTKKCVVIPMNYTQKRISRNANLLERSHHIEIGLLVRAKKLDMVSLLAQAQDIANICSKMRVGEAVCTAVEPEPLYDPEQLRQRNQFTSVLALTFKEVIYGGSV